MLLRCRFNLFLWILILIRRIWIRIAIRSRIWIRIRIWSNIRSRIRVHIRIIRSIRDIATISNATIKAVIAKSDKRKSKP